MYSIYDCVVSVLAITAANPDQSSYACYYDDKLQTYLGDVFSVNWMQDSDKVLSRLHALVSGFGYTNLCCSMYGLLQN